MSAAWAEVPREPGSQCRRLPEGRVGAVVVIGRLPRRLEQRMQEPQVCPAHQHLVNRLPILSCQLLVRCLRASEGRGRPGRVRGRGPRAAVNSASVVASAASCAAFTTSTSSRSRCRGSSWRASARSFGVLMMLSSPRPRRVPRLHCQWVEQRIPNEVATRCLSTNRS